MTARTKEELARAIDVILNSTSEPIDTAEKGARLRQRISEKLANEIDAYVQYQIGTRLASVLQAINASNADGSPVPVTPGPGFENFTRTS